MMVCSAVSMMVVSLLRSIAVLTQRHAKARAHGCCALDGDGQRHNQGDQDAGKAFTHRPLKSTAAEST